MHTGDPQHEQPSPVVFRGRIEVSLRAEKIARHDTPKSGVEEMRLEQDRHGYDRDGQSGEGQSRERRSCEGESREGESGERGSREAQSGNGLARSEMLQMAARAEKLEVLARAVRRWLNDPRYVTEQVMIKALRDLDR